MISEQRQWACIDGVLMPVNEARVNIFDAGFMQGIGLFETMRAYHGHVFRLQRHLDRLLASVRFFGWTQSPDPEMLVDSVQQVVQATGSDDQRVRLTVTPGSLQAASAGATPDVTVVATATAGGRYPGELYQEGVTVLPSACWQGAGDPTAGHKTTSYFARLASLRAAHAQSAFEMLWFTPHGMVAEGAISNVFVVRDEQLLTPPIDTPVLPGITRATVLELAVAEGIPAREQALTLEDVQSADEVFLTNSMFEIMPVVRIERTPVSNEKIGDVTRQLAIAYGKLIDRELEQTDE